MGVMLSVLVAGVGAMDLIYCLAYVSNQVTGEEPANAIEDAPEKKVDNTEQGLEQYRETIRQQIKTAPRSTVDGVTYAQDGVPYKDGYRLEPTEGVAQLDVLIEKLRVLERQSQEKEHQLEQMSVQMSELERNTVEQNLIIEELRSRSVSRAHSVEPSVSYRTNLSPADAVPQIVLNEPNDSGGGSDEPRPSSSKFRPIRRDDGLRRSVKRRSVTSTTSLEDRADELERLSQLEDEECARMDDYIPIVYSRDELDPMNRRHNISPIPESCHHHEDDERQWVPERSPEPTLAANITRPWGDIKLEEMKEKAVLRPARSMSIEEEDIEPPVVQLHVSESAPSNLSSHSNSPDRDRADGPTLRRTTKETDLTILLQQGASESKASSSRPWTTEIIVQDDETVEEDSDFDDSTYPDGTRTIPQFMQSKSPSPYADGHSYVAHERQPLADISNRLVPLVPIASVPYPSRPRSPTPYDEPGSSRESTPTSLPSSLEKIPNGFVSRDSSTSPHPVQQEELQVQQSASSLSSSPSTSSARSFAGDLRPGSVSASVRGVTPANDSGRMLSPLAALEVDAGTEGDTEGESDQLLSVPSRSRGASSVRSKSTDSSSSLSPRRKYKERKRVARSLTPIDYDQTFMDSFTEQRLAVSPSELEDYINSMDEINFVPPPLVKPAYIYPTALPSLVLTDELGTDAQFHDEMSSKAFYGQSHPHEGVTLNHRVSYIEWIKKFPDNQTSHLALEDFDSDDEEVENIIRHAEGEHSTLFPTDVPKSAGSSPQPSKPELPKTPENGGIRTVKASSIERDEFPVNLTPAYATPSPVSLVSDLSDLSSLSSHVTQPSQTLSSSLALGSPLLNTSHNISSEHHFTPIPSLSERSNDSKSPLTSSLQSPQPSLQTNTPLRPSLVVPTVTSRTPSVSPLPLDISPEELVFEIGHLDGLIFEAKSREPTPSRTSSRNEPPPLLSPDELAFDIGNMGGLILGPPSRSVSPLPPTPHPSLDSSASLSPTSWEANEQQHTTAHPAAHNETRINE
uniref:Uncharacterized protein n=1 Tax=Anopheles minimus TaxID=112268 RepID=A0A182WAQ2_9DIPT